MKNKMIKIDPWNYTVEEVILNTDNLDEIYATMNCRLIEIVSLGGGIDLILDEEGLLTTKQRFFSLGSVYAGVALVSASKDGEVIDCPKTVEDILEHLEWMPIDHTEEPFFKFIPMP